MAGELVKLENTVVCFTCFVYNSGICKGLYQTSIVESNSKDYFFDNFTISETKAFVAVVLYFVVISMCLRLQKIIHKFSYFFE